MDVFFIVGNSILMLFSCVAVGYICRKIGILNDEVSRGLSRLLVMIAVPSKVLVSMQRPFSAALFHEGVLTLFACFFVFFIGLGFAVIFCKLLKVPKAEQSVYLMSLLLPNIMYMGGPVMASVFGDIAFFYIAIANIPFTVILFSVGIKITTMNLENKPRSDLMSVVKNPAIICAVTGIGLFLASASLPKPINGALTMLADMTTPIAMMVIGGILANSDIRRLFMNKKMYVFIFLKLIAIPICVFFGFRPLVKSETLFGVLVMMNAMPTASITAIFANQYGANEVASSQFVCVATLFSAVTIPVVSLLLTAI